MASDSSAAATSTFPAAYISFPGQNDYITFSSILDRPNILYFEFQDQKSNELKPAQNFPLTLGNTDRGLTTANLFWHQQDYLSMSKIPAIDWQYTPPGTAVGQGVISDFEPVASSSIPPPTPLATSVSTVSSPSQNSPIATPISSIPTPPSSLASLPSVSPAATEVNTAATEAVKKDDGISKGGVVGIAIGCLVAGALIAGLLMWLRSGRSRRKHSSDQEASAIAFLNREKGAAAKAHSVETGSPASQAILSALPQPLEDKAISGEVSKLSNLIKNHVQSYYHTGRIIPRMLDLDDLQAFGSNLPISTGTLSTLLGNSETREIALRFSIAWVLVSRIEYYDEMSATFLPPEVARCFQSISLVNRSSRAHAIFFANWRAITAELLQPAYIQHPFSALDSRNDSIQTALDILDAILQPYADARMDNHQRRCNLEEILKRAASFAFTLFAQPGTWTFDWQEEQGVQSGSLCIFPALLQVTDETGGTLKPPRQFSDAVVRKLDG
ncbi:hypothetical protein CC78DRAFT_282382 [Lojkania enalia]|uniref:Uncharacterized protein n=1 Tax=Lojkania enalia TaxID=147567 RepID=A0A9P4NAC0_9PLEO|nr:hypothetical protein CC78DRAFT_282382 [Didymosphaeria enalia]